MLSPTVCVCAWGTHSELNAYCVQVQAKIQKHCTVYVQSEGLTPTQVGTAPSLHCTPRPFSPLASLCKPCASALRARRVQIREALFTPVEPFSGGVQTSAFIAQLERQYGPRVCVIPEGPECVGYLADQH